MKCTVCDGISFTIEDGIKVCDDCGTEVRKFQEVQSQEFLHELDTSCILRLKKERIQIKKAGARKKLTDIECFNLILREWTKALVTCGVSAKVEQMVLELWVLYLQRSGVAFLKDTDLDVESGELSKHDTTALKKSYCYFTCKKEVKQEVPNIISLDSLIEQKLEVMNIDKLFALLYLAVILTGEPILLMDIIRWCKSGDIPYMSIRSIEGLDVVKIGLPGCYDLDFKARKNTESLAMFLNILHFPIPSMKLVIDRIVNLLRLPDFVGTMSMEYLETLPESSQDIPVIGMEIYCVAAVFIILSAYLGLDDQIEVHVSRAVKIINKELEGDTCVTPLFCWEDWHRYINKLIWFCGEIDPFVKKDSQDREMAFQGSAESLSQFTWTEGLKTVGLNKEQLEFLALLHAQVYLRYKLYNNVPAVTIRQSTQGSTY